jgi:hypothetical protein
MATLTIAPQTASDLAYVILLSLAIGGLWAAASIAQSAQEWRNRKRGK